MTLRIAQEPGTGHPHQHVEGDVMSLLSRHQNVSRLEIDKASPVVRFSVAADAPGIVQRLRLALDGSCSVGFDASEGKIILPLDCVGRGDVCNALSAVLGPIRPLSRTESGNIDGDVDWS